jgi:exodeoxyribonuclease VII small subunit
MSDKNEAAEIAKLSYEQARDALAKVVQDLEAGSVTLEESMKLWERGEALEKHCQELLAGARTKIDKTLKGE